MSPPARSGRHIPFGFAAICWVLFGHEEMVCAVLGLRSDAFEFGGVTVQNANQREPIVH